MERLAAYAMRPEVFATRLHFDEKTLEPIVRAILTDDAYDFDYTRDPVNPPENIR